MKNDNERTYNYNYNYGYSYDESSIPPKERTKREKRERKERMTSIARKINWSFWRSKLGSYILFDIFLLFLFLGIEFYSFVHGLDAGFGSIVGIGFGRNAENAMSLRLALQDGTYAYKALRPMFETMLPFASAICGYQVISLFFSMFRTGRIRRKLQPLNDLASRAEVISNIPLDATHLENLERAIRDVNGTEENVKIETQDKDLQGIENALNGLLSRMKESQMQQTRFVSDASHELRTPIAVVQGYVNMLDRWGKEDPAVLNESIEALKHESQYMKDLVEQLLFLARGDSGRNNLKLVDIDLKDIVREVFEESMMIDADHEYRFVVQGVDCTGEDEEGSELILSAAPHMMIKGDVSMIKQSMRIFVQNASKYTAKGNAITLGVARNNGFVSYMVQDEGTGIGAEDIKHIFERFYRSDKARNGKTGGSGLGLSIAKWIVDAHEGRVDVVSRTDLGTRFTVSFPEQQMPAGAFFEENTAEPGKQNFGGYGGNPAGRMPEQNFDGYGADTTGPVPESKTVEPAVAGRTIAPDMRENVRNLENTSVSINREIETEAATARPERVEAQIVSEPAGNLVGVRMEAGPGIELVLEPKIEKVENPFAETSVPGFGDAETIGFEMNKIQEGQDS